MKYIEYIDFNYTPGKNDLICLFRVEPEKGITIKEAAGRVASESSTGTWTESLVTETKKIKKRVEKISAKVFEINGNFVKIAYPFDLFEPGNMPQIVSSIAGNVFGIRAVRNLRLEDISWPKKLIKSFRGPGFGVKGIRKVLNVKNRPLIATVPKPKLGFNTNEYINVAKKIWESGIDFVKNDENLTSQSFINFYSTTKKILEIRNKIEKKTGERKIYLPNVSAETKEMIKRVNFVKECGGEFVMADILTVGWSGTQTLRERCEDLKLGLYAHRAFHASFSRNPRHGLSMLCIANIARLIGVDALHIGGMGKLVSPKREVFVLKEALSKKKIEENSNILKKNWYNIKPVFGVTSGGLHPGIIPRIIELLGKDIIIQVGGGVIGHKMGILAGGRAVRQAIEASIRKIPLRDYAKTHEELKVALEMWGYKTPI